MVYKEQNYKKYLENIKNQLCLDWPAWETNYFFKEVDNIKNNPCLALISGISIVLMALIPRLLGLASGRYLIIKGKRNFLRLSYISLGILIAILLLITRS